MKTAIESISPVLTEKPKVAAPNEEAIRRLAYELWQARGCPTGSPEEDWFPAEQQIRKSLTFNFVA